MLGDLAVNVSRRGVVFFRKQNLTVEQQKLLADGLGKAVNKPNTSGLHIHPTAPAGGVLDDAGKIDPEVSIISSVIEAGLREKKGLKETRRAGDGWHSDITFEPVPSDYAILKIIDTPPTGGDTLWASGYSLYDKLSPLYQKFLETLTGTYSQPGFKRVVDGQYEFYTQSRGAQENIGDELTAVHPVIRSNPVTGWKSIFAIGNHFTKFNGLTDEESQNLKDYLHGLLVGSHDIQVRFNWGETMLQSGTIDLYTTPRRKII